MCLWDEVDSGFSCSAIFPKLLVFPVIFKSLFIYFERERESRAGGERERERMQTEERQRERERGKERTSSRLHTVSAEHYAVLDLRNCEIMT